jgi:hypothetical protein
MYFSFERDDLQQEKFTLIWFILHFVHQKGLNTCPPTHF